jgi:hypothetical protein
MHNIETAMEQYKSLCHEVDEEIQEARKDGKSLLGQSGLLISPPVVVD